jgi:hypothetical protein
LLDVAGVDVHGHDPLGYVGRNPLKPVAAGAPQDRDGSRAALLQQALEDIRQQRSLRDLGERHVAFVLIQRDASHGFVISDAPD